MRNSNIIDFFSRKSYTEITTRDYQINDELTKRFGTYLGCLKHQDSKALRDISAELDFKREQIDKQTTEWELLNIKYQEILRHCLNYLNSPGTVDIKLEKDIIMISENGHAWVIYDFEYKSINIKEK